METCSVEGCERVARSRGWCGKHYQRWYNHGDPLAILDTTGLSPIERFLLKVEVEDRGWESPCWIWIGTRDHKGYGKFWPDAKGVPAHRWSYENWVGPIPAGLQMDHLCRVHPCVNPDHVDPVTAKENQVRSPFDPAVKTHCPKGHLYDDANTYRYPPTEKHPRGRRGCRTCAAASRAAYEARKALAQ